MTVIRMVKLAFLFLVGVVALVMGQDDDFYCGTFPADFNWGLATASYQIEGAWNLSGKGENIWDEFTHRANSPIVDQSNGDIACDSYHKYQEDVQLLKNMGAKHYRFSLSWSRLLPNGTVDNVNPDGVEYYNKVIDELIANGIEPMVTLYHWDLPQPLMAAFGGWPNESIIPLYVDYADFAFKTFGDRVQKWITFNEPWVVCVLGYYYGDHAPGIRDVNQPYQCAHTIIKAHARTYRLYDRDYRPTQQGRVGITLDTGFHQPKNESDPADVAAAERALQFRYGWFASPIIFGKYPDVMRELVDNRCLQEGAEPGCRLPRWSLSEESEIRGTTDFLGLNHYTTNLATTTVRPGSGWDIDQDVESSFDPEWPDSAASWLKTVPWGFRKLLVWMKNTYGSPVIYVTENGYADFPTTGVNDTGRVTYYRGYINEMLKAVRLDGVNVVSYSAWSLLDNFEWARGYTERFGTHMVDFEDPERPRTPKESARFLTRVFADNGYPAPCNGTM